MPIRSRRAPCLAVALTTALLLAACGTGGDSAEDKDNDPSSTTSTTSGSAAPAPITVSDLESLLPTTQDVGEEFEVVEEAPDDEDDASKEALAKACPAAAEFFNDAADEGERATRSFKTSDDRSFEVTLDPTPSPNLAQDKLGKVIDALNACERIELQDQGLDIKIDLDAKAETDWGDGGVTVGMHVVLNNPQFPAPLELNFKGRAFLVGSVAVLISGSDGSDPETLETVPFDFDLIDGFSDAFAESVRELIAAGGVGSDGPGEDPAPAQDVDREALSALMPDESEFDAGYHSESDAEEGYDEPSEADVQMIEECPAAALLMGLESDKSRALRVFEHEDGRSVRVTLDPTLDIDLGEDTFADVISEADGCEYERSEDGVTGTMRFEVEANHAFGDRGARLTLRVRLAASALPAPVDIEMRVSTYVVGPVLVIVAANDGLDEATGKVIKGDFDRVDSIAADLEESVTELVG